MCQQFHRCRVLIVLAVFATLFNISLQNENGWVNKMKRPSWWEQRQREQGPNVCAVERITGTTRKYFSPWTGGSVCDVPTVIQFECCEGFMMMNDEPGCPLVKPIENIVESIKAIGLTALAHAINESGLSKPLSTDGPYTVFAPINNAFINASENIIYSMNRKTALQGAAPSLLMYHLVPNRVFYSEFKDEMQLETLHHRQTFRINKFSNGLVTVNCVPLVSVDLEATNGVIHTLENILKAPLQDFLTDFIIHEPTYSKMATILVHSKMTTMLRDKGPFTLFIPNDEAFEKIPSEELEALMNDNEAITALVKHHIVENIQCSELIKGKSTMRTLAGTELHTSCNVTNKFVEGAQILQGDIMVSNGIIHVIDQVLFPDKAKSLKQIAEELELTTLLSLMQLSALENVLTNAGRFTIIAPADSAFEALSNETVHELLSDASLLQDLLMAHIVPGIHTSKTLIDEQSLPTLKLRHRLRVKVSRKRTTIEEALVQDPDHIGRNGVVHVVDEVLIPPKLTIAEYLMANNMSTFVRALNHSHPSLLDLLNTAKGPYTVFAPDDYSFTLLPPGHLERMIGDPRIITPVMNDHIVEGLITTKSLLPNVYYSFHTRSNHVLHLQEEDGFITAGISLIRQPNIVCTNGIIHCVNRLIQLH